MISDQEKLRRIQNEIDYKCHELASLVIAMNLNLFPKLENEIRELIKEESYFDCQ